MIAVLIAAACTCTFSATATGLEKGAPVEFFFAAQDSDNAYETMFLVDDSIDEFCRKIEDAGIPRGKAESVRDCILWPVGCPVKIEPAISNFIATTMPPGLSLGDIIYTGGLRDAKGSPIAATNQPCAAFAFYSLGQSPLVFDGIYPQGDVYNAHVAAKTLKKGDKVKFTLSWDGSSRPKPVSISLAPGTIASELKRLKDESAGGRTIDVKVDFSPELTVGESIAAARALAVVDSNKVKINGRDPDKLFYRAFLPLEKWSDRNERLVQPFELTVTNDVDRLVYIEQDWSGDDLDPRLTPRDIDFAKAEYFSAIHTCFIYASRSQKLKRLYEAMNKLKNVRIDSWYVFPTN